MSMLLVLTALALGQAVDPATIAAVPEEAAAAAPPPVTVVDDGVVRLEGTPAEDPALQARLERYQRARSARLAAVDDTGQAVLISTRFAETQQVHRVGAPGAARVQLTFTEEPVASPTWVPGTEDLCYRADIGGNEAHQIWRQAPGGEPVLLTDGMSRHGSALWDDQGRQLAFMSNAANGTDQQVWLGDGRSPGANRLLVDEPGTWYPVDFSPDGGQLLVGQYISASASRLYVVDVGSGQHRRVDPDDLVASYQDARFGPEGVLYVTTDLGEEHIGLFEVDLSLDSWRPLTKEVAHDVGTLALSGDQRTLAFTVNVDGLDQVHLLDTRRRRLERIEAIDGMLVSGLTFPAESPRSLFLSLSGPTLPGDVFRYDLRRKHLERWTDSELGGLDVSALISPVLERTSPDGVPMWVYRPPGDGPFPVVVSLHGGPESQARPRFSSTNQFLAAELGIAVVLPNVRGSTGYGRSYHQADDGLGRLVAVEDVGRVLDWVEASPELDGTRIGVMGGSYGGYLTLASLAAYPDRVRAGIDMVGISSFVTFLENTGAYRRDLRRAEYGDERDPEVRAFLDEISPLHHVDEIRSALLVAHGANDPRVPVTEAEQIVEAVRANEQEVWYFLARDEGHGFRKKKNRDRYQQLMVQFLATHLD